MEGNSTPAQFVRLMWSDKDAWLVGLQREGCTRVSRRLDKALEKSPRPSF